MKVSIIIPAYNVERYIGACLRSVIHQTHHDWEAIVVNDGSPDGTLRSARLFAQNDPRVVVVDQPNSGVSAARNSGLDIATGPLVTFLDADDLLPRRSLEIRLRRLLEAEAEDRKKHYVVHGAVLVFDDTALATCKLREAKEDESSTFLERLANLDETTMVNVGLMLRRSTVGQVRFDTQLRYFEDIDFFFRIAQSANVSQVVSEGLVYGYRRRNDSAMRDEAALLRGLDAYIKKIQRRTLGGPSNELEEDRLRKGMGNKLMEASLTRLQKRIRMRSIIR